VFVINNGAQITATG